MFKHTSQNPKRVPTKKNAKTSIAITAALLLTFICVRGQEQTPSDTTKVTELKEVVITGENKVMSLSKKLFRVDVIDNRQIQQMAGNTLADVLNQNLNMVVTPDPSTGRSTISMFGLDGQYVKVLLDGIPIASDNGMGNNIDITQINMEDVERVEIVEGSMGVLYGDNAVAGVVNIVSKHGLGNAKWYLQASVQEETLGTEYAWFDRGRHIQNLKIGHQVAQNTYVSAGASRNDFAGFYNGYQGKDYVNLQNGMVQNDGLRGTEWNPKKQLTLFADLKHSFKMHALSYKLQYYDEALDIYSHTVNGRLNSNGEPNPTAVDKRYDTQRWVNNLTLSGPLVGPTAYNLALSYQDQKRYYNEYTYNILQRGVEIPGEDQLSQSSKILYSKGTVSNIFPTSDHFNLLLGYELTNQKGFDAIASGSYSTDVVENRLENYDFFGTADLMITPRFSLYPGARYTNNSQFGNKLIWSLSSTYGLKNNLKLKTIFGSAFRAPNFTELFYYFVDSNHNVQGNPNLDPEDGISIFVDLDKKWAINDAKGLFTSALKGYHFNIKDKIAFVTDEGEGTPLFTYKNVDRQRILGLSLNNTLRLERWRIGLGANYLGISTSLDASGGSGNSDYLWTLNLQSSLQYDIPKIKAYVSAQAKYNGRAQVILNSSDDELVLGQTNAFTWLDASMHKVLSKNLELTLGARNILDIVTVNAVDVNTGGVHGSSGTNNRLFGNGRSYFIKLSYLLTFK